MNFLKKIFSRNKKIEISTTLQNERLLAKNNFAKTFKTLRLEKRLSQKELAQELSISRQAISEWERGLSAPSMLTLAKLSKIFDIKLEELIS